MAAIKVIIGLSRHRPVSFLIASAALFSVCALIATRGVRTVRGDRILGDLEALFDALRHRASGLQPNYATNELALLVAVFGFEPLPATTYPFVHAFHPKRSTERPSDAGGSACGTTMSGGGGGGDSGGGGDGGGGGGGGCGGGGGGCGGCGSS